MTTKFGNVKIQITRSPEDFYLSKQIMEEHPQCFHVL